MRVLGSLYMYSNPNRANARASVTHVISLDAAPRFQIIALSRRAGWLEARKCTMGYQLGGRDLAKAYVHRDLDGLRTELEFEQRIAASEVALPELPTLSTERGR